MPCTAAIFGSLAILSELYSLIALLLNRPPFVGTSNESAYFLCVNRNKRSVGINIKSSAGQSLVKELAKQSDVFMENFLPGRSTVYQTKRLSYCLRLSSFLGPHPISAIEVV